MDLSLYLTGDTKAKIHIWEKHLGITDKKDYKWILKNSEKIDELISSYTSQHSKKNYYIVLAKMCKLLNDTKKYQIFKKKSTSFVIPKNTDVKKPSKLSKLLHWSDVIALRKKYKNESAEYPNDYKLHMKYLIICLLSYQPPLTTVYEDLLITYTKPKIDANNYLWIKSKTDHRIVINRDRVVKKTDDVIVKIESKTLMNIINTSLEKYKRTYLLSLLTNKNKPMQTKNINVILRQIDTNISIEIFKCAYIMQYLSNKTMDGTDEEEKHNASDKQHLAKQMRMTYGNLLGKFCKLKKQYAEKNKQDASDTSDEE